MKAGQYPQHRSQAELNQAGIYLPHTPDEGQKIFPDLKLIVQPGYAVEKTRHHYALKILRKRKETVEPVFGIIKAVMGIRSFHLRGLEKVNLELVSLAYNFKRIHRIAMPQTV